MTCKKSKNENYEQNLRIYEIEANQKVIVQKLSEVANVLAFLTSTQIQPTKSTQQIHEASKTVSKTSDPIDKNYGSQKSVQKSTIMMEDTEPQQVPKCPNDILDRLPTDIVLRMAKDNSFGTLASGNGTPLDSKVIAWLHENRLCFSGSYQSPYNRRWYDYERVKAENIPRFKAVLRQCSRTITILDDYPNRFGKRS